MDVRSLFEAIDAVKIDEFITTNKEEDLHLEYKLVIEPGMSRDDRKNLAKALSGFANSDGGIVIWGVDARPNQDGIDCACQKQEVSSVSLFVSKLNEFTGNIVNPSVDGVLHRKIIVAGDSGFAVTFVPSSDSGPHMAKGGEDRYYKRSGSSFYRMEHFDIEDLFGRRKKPKLSLHTNIIQRGKDSGPGGTFYHCGIVVGIENSGRGIAKYISLALNVNSPYRIGQHGLDNFGRFGLYRLEPIGPWQIRFIGDTNIYIHPKTIFEITIIERKIREGCPTLEDLKIEYEIIAEDIRAIQEAKIIKGSEILAKISNK